MDDIEKVVLNYLEEQSESSWKWIRGSEVLGKQETINRFKKDKKFRKLIVQEVIKTATDLFTRGSKKEK